MLNKKENEVMRAVYNMCNSKENCLISPYEILYLLPYKRKYTVDELEKMLVVLEKDDYFDIVHSERKGEPMYVITMHAKGNAYDRMLVQRKREVFFKVLIASVSAIVAGIAGWLVKLIFK